MLRVGCGVAYGVHEVEQCEVVGTCNKETNLDVAADHKQRPMAVRHVIGHQDLVYVLAANEHRVHGTE